MRSKRMIITMMIMITIMLIVVFLGNVINFSNPTAEIDLIKASKEQNNIGNIENTENYEENETTESSNFQNIQETRMAVSNTNSAISSRSAVDRYSTIFVNTDPNAQPEEEYEELKQYKKIQDIQISFDMDVSETTGLSKEDFISLVQNMSYDRTGILEKNAGFIWECCQKYSVNEIFVLGICGIESAWCSAPQHQSTHNYSSLMTGGHLIPYANDEDGFEAMIKLLGEKYLTPGASFYHGSTITGVGRCYCNPTSWPTKVFTCMQQVFK